MDELRQVEGTPAPAPPAPSIPSPQQDEEEGYVPPEKHRTSAKVAELRRRLRPKLLSSPDEFDQMSARNPEHRQVIKQRLQTLIQRSGIQLTQEEYTALEEAIVNDLLGFGAIEPLVQERSYSEIMVNGPEIIFAERKGKLTETQTVFDDEDHVQWTAQRIVRPLQRDLSRRNPMVDARLPDGSRVHIVMPPAALCGTTITIRKFPEKRLTWRDLVNFGSFTEDVARFLEACVKIRMNIVVSGGTGSGKTTLLNVISSFIPEDERTITIEDSAELQLSQRHVVRLETCPPMAGTNEGALTIRDLVKGSLRMRPDRVVVGEIRDGAAMDMLQAMNTGHDGSLTTVHANGPREAVARLETLCMMAGMDIPVDVIRAQIASAINLFVQQARLKDGSRKIIQITEVQGMEGSNITLQDIFVYKMPGQTSLQPSHEGGGSLIPTGMRPRVAERFEEAGIELPRGIWGKPNFNA
ncbi:MAG: CpaF family protein [Anaerolineae bacterium]|nr:CpaF family protein [Anaerolineae bacterium]